MQLQFAKRHYQHLGPAAFLSVHVGSSEIPLVGPGEFSYRFGDN